MLQTMACSEVLILTMTPDVTDLGWFWIPKSIVSNKPITGSVAQIGSPTRTSGKDSASKTCC